MDLDVCVDESGNPYLGHSQEYYEKSGEPRAESMPLWEAVDALARSAIPVIVDCKNPDAWPVVEEIITRIGPERCLVHTFASELRFNYDCTGPDFVSEWSPIERLRWLKRTYPSVTTTASAKFLPGDLLRSDKYAKLLQDIRETLKACDVDTICLNVPGHTYSDKALAYFLAEGIIPHINIDETDIARLSQVYIGETDSLDVASRRPYF